MKVTLWVGLTLTVLAMVAPYVDRAEGQVLASHILDGYPHYSAAQVDSAVTTYLVILTSVGVVGVVGWLWTLRAVDGGRPWTPWLAAALFVGAVTVALSGLTVKDTSGDVGLAPLLAWIEVLPCVAGGVAVVQLVRQRTEMRRSLS